MVTRERKGYLRGFTAVILEIYHSDPVLLIFLCADGAI